MEVKSRGTLIDGDWEIDGGEIKKLPDNWKERPGIVNHLTGKNPMLTIVAKTIVEKAIDGIKDPDKKDVIERTPTNLTHPNANLEGNKGMVRPATPAVAPVEKVEAETKKENVVMPDYMVDNYLGQNSNAIVNALEEDKKSINELSLKKLLDYEEKSKNREEVIGKIKEMLK